MADSFPAHIGDMEQSIDSSQIHECTKISNAADNPLANLSFFQGFPQPLARFFFLTDPDGYSIEVLQRSGRYR